MQIDKMGENKSKIKVYVDGANMFYAQKKLGWSFDWVKIKNKIEYEGELIECRYYTALKEGDEKMQSYLRYLDAVGFLPITKPLKKISEGDSFVYKANFDVEITADILLDKTNIDEIILFIGDSDFQYLLKRLKDAGKKVSIFSSKKTISWELKLVASNIIYFEKIRELIERKQNRPDFSERSVKLH